MAKYRKPDVGRTVTVADALYKKKYHTGRVWQLLSSQFVIRDTDDHNSIHLYTESWYYDDAK